MEPRRIGQAIVVLGGGRMRKEDDVDPAVGFEVRVKPGDRISAGDPLAMIHARSPDDAAEARQALESAIEIGDRATPLPLVSHRVTAAGVEPLA